MKAPAPLALEDTAVDIPAGTLLVSLRDLPDHGGKDLVFTKGAHRLQLLVQQFEGQIFVFENRCPHAGTPLNLFGDRFLDVSGKKLICRTHGALFDPQSGLCVRGPCKGDHLRPIAFEIKDGGVYSL